MSSWVEQRKATRSPEDKQNRGFTASRHHRLLNVSDAGCPWRCSMVPVFRLLLVLSCMLIFTKAVAKPTGNKPMQSLGSTNQREAQTVCEHWVFLSSEFRFLWLVLQSTPWALCVTLSDISQQPPVLLLHSKCRIYPHVHLHLLK